MTSVILVCLATMVFKVTDMHPVMSQAISPDIFLGVQPMSYALPSANYVIAPVTVTTVSDTSLGFVLGQIPVLITIGFGHLADLQMPVEWPTGFL